MEHSWHSKPQVCNLCPICSNSHFPFCLPPPQYLRPPPPRSQYSEQFFHHHLPPMPPPPPYDPFIDHQGPPAANPYARPPQLLPRPWSNNSNVGEGFYGNLKSRLDYDDAQTIGAKRMRIDYSGHSSGPGHYVNGDYMIPPGEDERRLKLIRDHGAMNHDLNMSNDLGKKISAYTFEKMNHFSHPFQGNESGYCKESNMYGKRNFDAEPEYRQKEVADLGRLQYERTENNFMQNQACENNSDRAYGYKNLDQARRVHQTHMYNTLPTSQEIIEFPTQSQPEFSKCISQSGATHHQAMEPKYHSLSGSNENRGQLKRSQGYNGQPPLPTSPPPPLPVELPGLNLSKPGITSSASVGGFLFPVPAASAPILRAPYPVVSEGISSEASEYSRKANPNSGVYYTEEIQAFQMAPSNTYLRESEDIPSHNLFSEKSVALDVSHILKKPHRSSRPDHIVIILRGLPGSGKSYLAKMLRDLEVENGGSAPRIHSMDDYFMIEVEKVEDSEGSKSNSSVRGKKPTKKVMEYCYEPEMEEAYRSSMLKAFKKTLDEGVFSFVIVDDRNLRVADFAQFWATAKTSGYEVYLLEATYKDPVGCAARNVHCFSQNDIQKMAKQWEDAPPLYMKLDVTSLLHGDDLEENGIQEVDMDTEDGDHIGGLPGSEDASAENTTLSEGTSKDEQKLDAVEQYPIEVVTELGKSKWSNDLDEDDVQRAEVTRVTLSALAGLAKSYSNQGWQYWFFNRCCENSKCIVSNWSWFWLQLEVESPARGR
ncbi:uncharacterized protein [Henckelia pumila]|uniref:uncharacterized protein isoform X2 n=1 Tax=Henckelia pumila TaxID=405737 RepID=UPI003C6E3830